MNPQPGCLPITLITLLVSFLFFFNQGCSEEKKTEPVDQNSTAGGSYPIDFCLVSGNDLDEEGSDMIPFTYVHEGTTIKFCCEPCLPKFKKNPEKYLIILQEEIDSQKEEPKS